MTHTAGPPGPQDFAAWQSWLDAWNRHDLDAIMEHYADGVTFTSRVAVELGLAPSGSIIGKTALRHLFATGLAADPELRFVPLHAFVGVGEHALHYTGFRRRAVIEIHALDAQGKIITARAYHGPRT